MGGALPVNTIVAEMASSCHSVYQALPSPSMFMSAKVINHSDKGTAWERPYTTLYKTALNLTPDSSVSDYTVFYLLCTVSFGRIASDSLTEDLSQ